jgi:predicted enzyme related to lactoylglutathione lyase
MTTTRTTKGQSDGARGNALGDRGEGRAEACGLLPRAVRVGHDPSIPGYYSVAPADGGIGGCIRQALAGVSPRVTFYVSVDDDLEPHLTMAESLGGKTIVVPTPSQNGGAFALILDPEEHVIGLIKMPAAQHARAKARATRQAARLGRAAHARWRVPVGDE